MNTKHKYTVEQDAMIIKLWNDGHSGTVIAGQMELSRCAILGKLHRLRHAGHSVETRATPEAKENRFKAVEEKRKQLPLFPFQLHRMPKVPKIVLYQIQKEAQKSKHLTLMELKSTSCRFIVDNSSFGEALYCGDTMHKGSYCEDHALLCYVPKDKEGQRLRKEALNYKLVKLNKAH